MFVCMREGQGERREALPLRRKNTHHRHMYMCAYQRVYPTYASNATHNVEAKGEVSRGRHEDVAPHRPVKLEHAVVGGWGAHEEVPAEAQPQGGLVRRQGHEHEELLVVV